MRHVMGIMDGTARKPLEMGDKVAGERAVIHVPAGDHARRGDGLAGAAPFHHERNPFGELLLVLRIFHAFVAVMRGQRGVSLFEKSHVGGAVHKTHMRAGMDEDRGSAIAPLVTR